MVRSHVVPLLLVATLAALGLAGGACAVQDSCIARRPSAEHGVLDLRDYDLSSRGTVSLTGEWEFYWRALLTPAEVASGKEHMTGYMRVPISWNGYVVGSERLSGDGYATYALRILTNGDGALLALRVPAASTAHRLWVNGLELASSGTVAENAEGSVPHGMPVVVSFYDDGPEVSLVIQVSNFAHRRGGMWQAPVIGREHAVQLESSRLMVLDVTCMVSLMTIGVYHISLYVQRKKELSTLYYALACILFGIRALFLGDVVLMKMWPSLSWDLALRVLYLTAAGILPLGLSFCREVYPDETSLWVVRGSQVCGLASALVTITLPTRLSSILAANYQKASILFCAYIAYALGSAIIHKRPGAVWTAVGALSFVFSAVHDVLYYGEVVKASVLSSLGIIVGCAAQAYALSARHSGALTSIEKLSGELADANRQLTELNTELERRIEDKTTDLQESNRRLEMINREIEQIEQSRKRLLTNIAHDLRTPVTLIRGYVEAMLDGVIDGPEEMTKYLELTSLKVSGLSMLIEDLFELTQLESRKTTFNMRRVRADEMIAALYMKYEPDIAVRGIDPLLIAPTWEPPYRDGGPSVIADPERIDRVFANLIFNALKFTPKGGRITVSYGKAPPVEAPEDAPGAVIISVADTGPGIPRQELRYLFDRFYKVHHSRSRVAGSGLGLSIAKEIVELHGGRIWVESSPNKGSTFHFTIPVATDAGDDLARDLTEDEWP